MCSICEKNKCTGCGTCAEICPINCITMKYDKEGYFPFERIRPVVAEILKTVIADGKGIEINTSSHRYGLRDLTPSRDILRLYRDLGGEVITIGSDSHKKEHLGAYVRETMGEMKELGFKAYYTFDKMIPVPHYFKAPLA